MGRFDNVSNLQHWESLLAKAIRGGWQEDEYYDPVMAGPRTVLFKRYLRRILQPYFLFCLFGDEPTGSGMYDADVNEIVWPRYEKVAYDMFRMIITSDEESVLAYLDSLPTKDGSVRPEQSQPQGEAPEKP